MKATFFHDSIFIKDNETYYTRAGLNQEVIDEYINQFGSLTTVTRVIDKDNNTSDYIKDENRLKNIDVYGINKKYFNVFKVVKQAMKNTQLAIIRLPSIVGLVAVYYAKKYKKNYYIECVGCAFDSLWYHSLLGKIIAPIIFFLNKNAIKDCKNVIYVTNKYLQSKYPCKYNYFNCSDVRIIPINEQQLETRINNTIKKKKIIIRYYWSNKCKI